MIAVICRDKALDAMADDYVAADLPMRTAIETSSEAIEFAIGVADKIIDGTENGRV